MDLNLRAVGLEEGLRLSKPGALSGICQSHVCKDRALASPGLCGPAGIVQDREEVRAGGPGIDSLASQTLA